MGPTGPPRLDRVEAPSRLVLGVAAGNVRRRIKGLSIRYAHVADWADWGPAATSRTCIRRAAEVWLTLCGLVSSGFDWAPEVGVRSESLRLNP